MKKTSKRWKIAYVAFAFSLGLISCKQDFRDMNDPIDRSTPTASVAGIFNLSGYWEVQPGFGTDIGIGADGSVFKIGADEVSPTGGYSISKWNGISWDVLPYSAGIRIAVDQYGTPWVVNKSNLIFRYNGTMFEQVAGTATDIGIGADGSVFKIGTDEVSPTGGFSISKWNGYSWDVLPYSAGVRIAVDQYGTPWVVNKSNLIFRYNGTMFEQIAGTATDIGIGADGSIFKIGNDEVSQTGGFSISKWNGSSWDFLIDCAGINIAVNPTGKPWVTNKSNLILNKLN